jgi:hypothetical protein
MGDKNKTNEDFADADGSVVQDMSKAGKDEAALRQYLLQSVFRVASAGELDKASVWSVFDGLDRNGDGSISRDEFRRAAAETSGGEVEPSADELTQVILLGGRGEFVLCRKRCVLFPVLLVCVLTQ